MNLRVVEVRIRALLLSERGRRCMFWATALAPFGIWLVTARTALAAGQSAGAIWSVTTFAGTFWILGYALGSAWSDRRWRKALARIEATQDKTDDLLARLVAQQGAPKGYDA